MTPQMAKMIRQLWIWTGVVMIIFVLNSLINYSWVYWFLPYNLMLAWIPLGLAVVVVTSPRRWQRIAALLWWLLFLPNAFYIITDYLHLFDYTSRVSYLFDAGMIGAFSLLAFAIGLLSLEIVMTSHLMRRFGHYNTLLVTVAGLSGIAIYIGRVLRWNSWDMLINPIGMIHHILSTLAIPGELELALLTTALFGALVLSCYALARRVVATT